MDRSREDWLYSAKEKLDNLLERQTGKRSPDCFISIGAAFKGDRKGKVLGNCYTTDGKPHIFITARYGEKDTTNVLAVLLHELIHAACPGHGHGGDFKKMAKACSFESPLTHLNLSFALERELKKIAEVLPKFPMVALRPLKGKPEGGKKKQSTRMLKTQCPLEDCGYIARVSRMWLDIAGPPVCPQCRKTMEQV